MTDVPSRLASALADRYRIERELGAGGMATVYLAEDLKHDRKVALKVLRPELAAVLGAERFLAEIKTTANLQHPHILPLHDSGEAGSHLFYVMPYVEGESLRERLGREKQLPVHDAIRIASEVASALDYAHRHGVIHRDIKPENILLHDGSALVADFGIALAVSKVGGSRMTETGISLGTPHYMSPEQAVAEREITGRSDIYALGCVTYEMLIGEPPFTGPTAQAILARGLTEEAAPLASQRHTIPPHVEAAVLTALEKLPADRFASATEFADALAGHYVSGEVRPAPAGIRSDAAPWRTVSAFLAVLVLVLLGQAVWNFTRSPGTPGPSVYDAALPDSAPMSFAATAAANVYGTPLRNLSVAEGADFAVYTALRGDSTALWYRSLRDATARPIAGTVGATAPRISPDGSRVAYFVGGAVWVVPVSGGAPRKLFEGRDRVSLDWVTADTLIALDQSGYSYLLLDPETGLIRQGALSSRCGLGNWVPAVRELLCSVSPVGFLLDPETGRQSAVRVAAPVGHPQLSLQGSAFRVVDGRYLVFIGPDGDLRGAPFDPRTALAGRSVALVRGIRREGLGAGHFDIAGDGTLLYAPGSDVTVGRIVRLGPDGHAVPLPVPEATFQRFDLSPDRRWLAAAVLTTTGQELRLYDLRDAQEQTWLNAEYVGQPLWSPSGQVLVVGVRDSSRRSVVRETLAGEGGADTLVATDSADAAFDPSDWPAPDDLVLQRWIRSAVYHLAVGRSRSTPHPVVDSDAVFASVSPDGRHLAYQTAAGSRVVVTSYPNPGRRWQVASEGVEPVWLSATQLLYRLGDSWYSAWIGPTGEPVERAKLWGRDPRFSDTPGWSNRPSGDGGILYVQGPPETTVGYLRVIPHWVAQMERAVDEANR